MVKAAAGSGVEVYLDGGIRLGTDVLKAIALGARAVFIGRPVLWGLTYKVEQINLKKKNMKYLIKMNRPSKVWFPLQIYFMLVCLFYCQLFEY